MRFTTLLLSRKPGVFGVAAALALAIVCLAIEPGVFAQSNERWVGTWATAEVGRPQNPAPFVAGPAPFMANNRCPVPAAPPVAPAPGQTFAPTPYIQFTNQTLRQIVHTSIGGSKARVVLSNAYGTAPVIVGAAHVALRDKDAGIQATTGHPLTFSGHPTMTIPANAIVYSDPVDLTVPAMSDIAIDLYLPGTTNTPASITMHGAAHQTSYISETGNHAGKATMPVAGKTESWFMLSRVDVVAPDAIGTIVAFGDSITDGTRSTPDTNHRWPDLLANRLIADGVKMGVLNAGIGGNRVLGEASVPAGVDTRAVGAGINALARFERHVLSIPGVTHVIVLEGINDFGLGGPGGLGGLAGAPPLTAAELIAGLRQLIERAHAHGLKIIGGTLLPFEGTALAPFPTYYSTDKDARRQAVNEWIRTGKAYDGIIDFDLALRDPAHPLQLVSRFKAVDNLHLNDAGYQAMATTVNLALLRR